MEGRFQSLCLEWSFPHVPLPMRVYLSLIPSHHFPVANFLLSHGMWCVGSTGKSLPYLCISVSGFLYVIIVLLTPSTHLMTRRTILWEKSSWRKRRRRIQVLRHHLRLHLLLSKRIQKAKPLKNFNSTIISLLMVVSIWEKRSQPSQQVLFTVQSFQRHLWFRADFLIGHQTRLCQKLMWFPSKEVQRECVMAKQLLCLFIRFAYLCKCL